MTAVTVTPLPGIAAVRVQVTGAPAGDVEITRSDTAGTFDVRRQPGEAPIAGVLTLTDYEPSLIGTLTYRVTDSAAAVTTATTTLAGAVTVPVLHDVLAPGARFTVPSAVTGLNRHRESGSLLLDVIGRPDPVGVLEDARTPTGSLVMRAASWTEALAMEAVLARASVFMLRQPLYPGMDQYLAARAIDLDPTEGLSWQVTVAYTGKPAPTGDLASAAGWTWADVETSYATWADVAAAFTTWNALLVGP